MNYHEVLKASKGLPVTDYRTMLFARKIRKNNAMISTVSSCPCVIEKLTGKSAVSYAIYGNIAQNGTPSPEFPVEVLGCGDRTRNLFDFKTIYSDSSKFKINNDAVTASAANFNDTKIKLSSAGLSIGDSFCFSALIKDTNVSTSARVAAMINGQYKQGLTISGFSSITATMLTNEDWINVTYSSDRYSNIIVSNIQLELGSEATPYVPYGYEIPVVNQGKNLFDFKTIYSDTSKFKIDGNSVYGNIGYMHSVKIQLHNLGLSIGDTFCFSAIIQNTDSRIKGRVEAVINGKSIRSHNEESTTPYLSSIVASVETTDDFIRFTYEYGYFVFVSNIQLELGSEATEYEPYRDPIMTPIYLPKPLYKNDYIRKDRTGGKVHREWGVKVFDGTEEFSTNAQIKSWFMLADSTVYPNKYAYCTHFSYNSSASALIAGQFSTGNTIDYTGRYVFRMSDGTTLDDFKAFLASEYAKGTPVTVYYPLATPTEEPIELPDLPLEIGYNMIDVDTEIKPEKMSITYKADKAAAQADEALTNEILNLMEAM